MEMYDFFYAELRTLKARTGYNQWDKLNEAKDPVAEIDLLIELMIVECAKDPYNKVSNEVKQRVISRAVVEDPEFIGLNQRFVARALRNWWNNNADRVLEKINQKEASVYERVELSPERRAEIDRMLDEYKARILQGEGMRMIPKVEHHEKVGAEWKSDLERKALSVQYQPPDAREVEIMDRIRKAGSELYKGRLELNLKLFHVESFQILAESESDAEKIYQLAINPS